VTEVTPFSERVRESLREQLLDSAADLLPSKGFQRLRMADVAAATGVSRQTVYNEFGSKEALVEAVAMRTAAEFLEGVDARLRAAPDVLAGLRDALTFTLRHASENRLVASVLGSTEAEDLMPFLTTKSQPVLRPSVELISTHLRERVAGMDRAQADLIAENTVRLVFSHMVLPTGPPARAADDLVRFIAPAITHHDSI
jgi:AcrR family transcriptional regulator